GPGDRPYPPARSPPSTHCILSNGSRRPKLRPMNPLFDVSGKVVLVTGGSRGIGEMIARGFVDAGAKVYISSRKAEVGEALAKELSKIGSCTSLPADLSSEAECRRLAGEIAARESHLD